MDISLDKITNKGRAIYLAYDHGMEHGPTDFTDENIDPAVILKLAYDSQVSAVVFQKGVAEKYFKGSQYEKKIPLIVKLNGKTSFIKDEPYSPQICTIEEALKFGASAVGYTVYVGSQRQDLMFKEFAAIEKEAHQRGIPLVGWMYPRGSAVAKETPEITAYAARVGLEMGADIVKIKFTGDLGTFRWAVESAGKTKVVMSGGPKTNTDEEFLDHVRTVIDAGAIGVAVGRNVWQAKNPSELLRKIKEIVFKN
jgi:class I fructose-bisphosphate aldolase